MTGRNRNVGSHRGLAFLIPLVAALSIASAAPVSGQVTPLPGQDMTAYLRATHDMVGEGRYAEALERTLWFHEHALEHEPAMAGVRLSFALGDWEKLGAVYPPAMAALAATVDSTLARLLRSPADEQLFMDMSGFYRHSDSEANTIELFERISAANPEVASVHWRVVVRDVIDAKRLDLLQKYGVDLLELFAWEKTTYELTIGRESGNAALASRMRASRQDSLLRESLQLIQTALDLGQRDTATTIQTRALELLPGNERLRTAVP
jgi:hypothetical protein